jgi:hypothetical protein
MELTTRIEQLVPIKDGERAAWCASCNAEIQMITAFEAARLAGVSSYTIFDWAETGKVHHFTTPKGVLLICPGSFLSVSK